MPKSKINKNGEEERQVFDAVIINPQGRNKTTVLKRFGLYFYTHGYKSIWFDSGGESLSEAKYSGSSNSLHPLEYPIKLPVISYLPTFVKNLLVNKETGEDIIDTSHHKIFSHKIIDFREKEEWTSFGFGYGTVDELLNKITESKTNKEAGEILKNYLHKIAVNASVKDSIKRRLGNLVSSKFFDENYNTIPINDLWVKEKIIVAVYYGQEPKYISASIGNLLKKIELISTRDKSPKLLIIDDAPYVVGKKMIPSFNLSARNTINAMKLWRKLGVNLMLATQTVDGLNEEVMSMATHLIIGGGIPNADYLINFNIDRENIDLIKRLRPDMKNYVTPYLIFDENRLDPKIFYPAGARVGHSW